MDISFHIHSFHDHKTCKYLLCLFPYLLDEQKKKKMIGVPDKMKNFLKIVLISQAFENVIVHFMMNV